jgi:hypothetical protein
MQLTKVIYDYMDVPDGPTPESIAVEKITTVDGVLLRQEEKCCD